MELTRRDAIAALATVGIGVGSVSLARQNGWIGTDPEIDENPIFYLQALTEVLYPSNITVSRDFLETYVTGRIENDHEYYEELIAGIKLLDNTARDRHGKGFTALSASTRDDVLRDLHLHDTPPDPQGEPIHRARYYLLDELLYALFTSPTGGKLVGTENPVGHPGGIESYRREEPR